MKTIIAGSRSLATADTYTAIQQCPWEITEVVCGGAKGPDRHGAAYADLSDLPVTEFPADWDMHGKAAGPVRNQQMAEYADALLAVWDGKSRGTKDMIARARRRGLKVHVYLSDRS